MPLNPLLPVLLQALLFRVDLDQRRKTGQDIFKFELLLLQFAGVFVYFQLQSFELHLMSALHVLDLRVVMEDHPCQLILVLFLDNVGMGQLLTDISPFRTIFLFDSWQEAWEFVDGLLIFCVGRRCEGAGTGILYDGAFPETRGE